MFIGVIAVRVFGLSDSDLIGGISVSLFSTLVGITLLFSIVTQTGALAAIMNSATAAPLMGLSAGLLSLVSSARSVVYSTMMPMCIELAAQVGAHPVALMSAVAAGGALAGFSPMSTGGALIMGALGNELKGEFTKEYQNKVFVQLLIFAAVTLVILLLCAALFYNPLANLFGSAA